MSNHLLCDDCQRLWHKYVQKHDNEIIADEGKEILHQTWEEVFKRFLSSGREVVTFT
jgi:hypothetical protein